MMQTTDKGLDAQSEKGQWAWGMGGKTQATRRVVFEFTHGGRGRSWPKPDPNPLTRRLAFPGSSVRRAHCGRNGPPGGFRVLGFVNSVAGELFRQFLEVFLCQRGLLLTPGREGQQDFGKWPQIVAVVGGFFHFRHAEGLISVNAAKPEEEAGGTG